MSVVQPIMHSDLTDQQVSDIARRIEIDIRKEDGFSAFFEKRKWPKGRVSIQYRVLVHQPIKPDEVDNFTLEENIAPTPRSLKYATFAVNTKDYGTRYVYTKKDVEYNADDVVRDCSEELSEWGTKMKTFLAAKCLLASQSSVTFNSGDTIRGLIRKVDQIFTKLHCKKWDTNSFVMLCPSQISDVLTEEVLAANGGNSAPENAKAAAMNGYLSSYKHFDLFDPDCDELLNDGTNYKVIFMAKTPKGTYPTARYFLEGEGTEVIHNKLGQGGVLEDKDGKIVADYNKQQGAIAENLNGLSFHILDHRAVIVCTIPQSYLTNNISLASGITPSDLIYNDAEDVANKHTVANGAPAAPTASVSMPLIEGPAKKVKVGETLALRCNAPKGKTVTWASSATAKATVANGVVTGVATGDTVITASWTIGSATFTASYKVTVVAAS